MTAPEKWTGTPLSQAGSLSQYSGIQRNHTGLRIFTLKMTIEYS
jgi:hypothetical protein